jgi:chorismate mutase
LKGELGMPVYQPDREKKVLEKVRQSAQDLAGPLTCEAVVRIFERIIDEARRAERESGSNPEDFGPSIGE